jgi:hypothetical protein
MASLTAHVCGAAPLLGNHSSRCCHVVPRAHHSHNTPVRHGSVMIPVSSSWQQHTSSRRGVLQRELLGPPLHAGPWVAAGTYRVSSYAGVRVSSAATDLLELTEENVEKVLDEVSTALHTAA